MCQDFFCFFKNVTHDILLLHILTILPDDCQMENQPHHWTNNVYLFNTFISFLFTHPMWDVTDTEVKTLCTLTISTHTSRVGCDVSFFDLINSDKISTHTSRVGCDPSMLILILRRCNFYSHIPCGMWPSLLIYVCQSLFISTHTSRVGCDGIHARTAIYGQKFLLTHPVWDVTSIRQVDRAGVANFYSHIPCGMWRYVLKIWKQAEVISTHTSRVGCDFNQCLNSK